MVLWHWLCLIGTTYIHNFAENVSPKSAEVTQRICSSIHMGPYGTDYDVRSNERNDEDKVPS